MEDNFSMDWELRGDDSSALHLLCTLFLLLLRQLHVTSSGIRSERLGPLLYCNQCGKKKSHFLDVMELHMLLG